MHQKVFLYIDCQLAELIHENVERAIAELSNSLPNQQNDLSPMEMVDLRYELTQKIVGHLYRQKQFKVMTETYDDLLKIIKGNNIGVTHLINYNYEKNHNNN